MGFWTLDLCFDLGFVVCVLDFQLILSVSDYFGWSALMLFGFCTPGSTFFGFSALAILTFTRMVACDYGWCGLIQCGVLGFI